jgi:ComF family protein
MIDTLALLQQVTGRIAPPVCVLCGGVGQAGEEAWGLDLCAHCQHACERAHAPDPAPARESADVAGGGCDRLRVLFAYRPPVDRLVTQLKFAREPAPARVLGMLLARELRTSAADANAALPECIVPMPLHPLRLRERGFNQCELIARHLGRRLGIPVNTGLLERRRHTEAQSSLAAAARRANVAGAFGPAARAARTTVPKHVALLDDVMTTGSTLAEAAGALRAAGVRRIEGWICARAPRDGGSPRSEPTGPVER